MGYQTDLFNRNPAPVDAAPLGLSYAPIAQQKIAAKPKPVEPLEPVYVPFIQMRPNYSIMYSVRYPAYRAPKENQLHQFVKESDANRYTGQINPKSAAKLRRAIELLTAISSVQDIEDIRFNRRVRFRLSFLTLTLSAPQGSISDYEIKNKLLNHFLISAQRKWGLAHYVWRAEKQKNGNLHFHIITNCYIPFEELRAEWNRIQAKLGFIDAYKSEFYGKPFAHYLSKRGIKPQNATKEIRNAWKDGNVTKWENPNSVDVRKVKHVRDLASYLCKYLTKATPEDSKVDGKVWDCSTSLKVKVNCSLMLTTAISEELNTLTRECKQAFVYKERCTIVKHQPAVVVGLQRTRLSTRWLAYLRLIRSIKPKASNMERSDIILHSLPN